MCAGVAEAGEAVDDDPEAEDTALTERVLVLAIQLGKRVGLAKHGATQAHQRQSVSQLVSQSISQSVS